jgi:hypothetical protein
MDDLRIEWPWSLEEEIHWKAKLAERDAEVEDLIDVENTEAPEILRPKTEEVPDEATADKYLVTA